CLLLLEAFLATGCGIFRPEPVFVYATILPGELPGRVRSGFGKAMPGARVEKVEVESFRRTIEEYRIRYRSPDGTEESVVYDREGRRVDPPGRFPLEPQAPP